MNCLVTAGPTFEPLDQVRRLTNHSTGRLGTGLADFLADQGHAVKLLFAETATCPPPCRAQIHARFTTTADLQAHFQRLASSAVQALFHVAAVSDFMPAGFWTRSRAGELQPLVAGKVPSNIEPLWIELRQTPKLIARLRDWFPQAIIVGWKYEVDGDRVSAIARGRAQLNSCRASACVVNGPAYGTGFCIVMASDSEECVDEPLDLYRALARLIGD